MHKGGPGSFRGVVIGKKSCRSTLILKTWATLLHLSAAHQRLGKNRGVQQVLKNVNVFLVQIGLV